MDKATRKRRRNHAKKGYDRIIIYGSSSACVSASCASKLKLRQTKTKNTCGCGQSASKAKVEPKRMDGQVLLEKMGVLQNRGALRSRWIIREISFRGELVRTSIKMVVELSCFER